MKTTIRTLAITLFAAIGCGDNIPAMPATTMTQDAGTTVTQDAGTVCPTPVIPACSDNVAYGYCGTADSQGYIMAADGSYVAAVDGYIDNQIDADGDLDPVQVSYTPEEKAAFPTCVIANDGFGNKVTVESACPRQ
jgi:hypothetical protein